jgi:pimeloyl-ACP methyl ester carboxylesterase
MTRNNVDRSTFSPDLRCKWILVGAALCFCLVAGAAALAQLPPKPAVPQPAPQPVPKPAVTQPVPNPAVPQPAPPAATQPIPKPATPKPATPAPKPKDAPEMPPEPVPMQLDTKDGWKIHCLYYPPKEKIRKGTETVPIILVHGWGGQGSEWNYLATGLQTYGHAAIVPDLRGHGRSTTRKERDGSLSTVKYDDLKPQDMDAFLLDLEAVKSELLKMHNASEVNIELLTVVAAQEGCIIALNWAAWDWHWPITPAYKQGQDVKALILLSPTDSFRRMNATAALNTPAIQRQLSLLFAVGAEDRKSLSDASRMHSRIEKLRPSLKNETIEEQRRLRDIFFIAAPTTLQGTKLTDASLRVNRAIVEVIQMRLLNRRDEFRWAERRSPVGG